MLVSFNPVLRINNQVSFSAKRMVSPVYAVSPDGECTKYKSISQAAVAENRQPNIIKGMCYGETKKPKDKYFVFAKDLEDKTGNVDAVKLAKVMRVFSQKIYRFDIDGKCTIYKDMEEAISDNNVARSAITSNIKKENGLVHGKYFFMRANDIEEINDDGSVSVNKYKVEARANQKFYHRGFYYSK